LRERKGEVGSQLRAVMKGLMAFESGVSKM